APPGPARDRAERPRRRARDRPAHEPARRAALGAGRGRADGRPGPLPSRGRRRDGARRGQGRHAPVALRRNRLAGRGRRAGRRGAADVPALPSRRPRLGGRAAQARRGVRLQGRRPDRRHPALQPARARHPCALEPAEGHGGRAQPARPVPRLPDAADLGRRRVAHQDDEAPGGAQGHHDRGRRAARGRNGRASHLGLEPRRAAARSHAVLDRGAAAHRRGGGRARRGRHRRRLLERHRRAEGTGARLQERIIARDQKGASDVLYRLMKQGRPVTEITRETVRIHAPYTHVPYHQRLDDGIVKFVNNDHCLLSERVGLPLRSMIRPELAWLPMAQTVWYMPTGLDPWNQLIGKAPGHYTRLYDIEVNTTPPLPERHWPDQAPVQVEGALRERLNHWLTLVQRGEVLESYRVFLGLMQDVPNRRHVLAQLAFAGLIDVQDRMWHNRSYTTGHKGYRARATIAL